MTKERGASLIFLFAGIYGFIFSVGLPLGKWNEPGPGVFPLALSILLCLSGILWFIQGKKRKEGRMDWWGLARKRVTSFQIVALTAAFILSLDRLGYLLASSLYMFVLLAWISRYRVWAALGMAIALGGGTWFFFQKVLAVPLPRGCLPF